MRNLLLLIAFAFLFAGCSQKVLIETTKPAKIDRATTKNKVAVLEMKGDSYNLASKIESKLNNAKAKDKKVFTIVNRQNINQVLKEQRFQTSGLTEKGGVRVGKLLGAEAIIIGNATKDKRQDRYEEQRTKCVSYNSKGVCKRSTQYTITCTRHTFALSSKLSMVDVQAGDVIYSDTYSKSIYYNMCRDRNRILPTESAIYNVLADHIVDEFVPNIAPTPHKFYVKLLEDPEYDYTSEQDKKLESALTFIKDGRLDRAEMILSELLSSTNDKCFVAAYNLGVVKEAKGEYELAKDLYTLADNNVDKSNKLINEAIVRINEAINDQNRLNNQASKIKGKKK